MYCRNCGKELSDEAVVCPACGIPTDNYAQKAPARKTNALAITGFIFSLLGIIPQLGLILGPAGLILSIIGLKKADMPYGNLKGLSIAGIIIGSIITAFWLIVLLVVFITVIVLLSSIAGAGQALILYL